MAFVQNGYLPEHHAYGYSLELSPWQGISLIPEHERNGYERDYAHAVGVAKECEHMPCNTIEAAAKLARRVLFAEWLTGGEIATPPFMLLKMWEAARHVEHLTAMRFVWFETGTRREVTGEEAARRVRAGLHSAQPGAITRANADPAVYGAMTPDEFVLALCAFYCCQRCQHWVSSLNLACRLYAQPAVQRRIRSVLLPELAARDVGERVHMDVSQWESLWVMSLVPRFLEGLRMQPPASAMAAQARAAAQAAASRLLEVAPQRAMHHKVAAAVAAELKQPVAVYSAACSLARLGQEQGNDLAVAIGGWLRAFSVLIGAAGPRVASYRLGELREMAVRALAAGKRLKRWHMKSSVTSMVRSHMAFVTRSLADLQHLPDSARVRLPHVTPAAEAAAEAAAASPAASSMSRARAAAATPHPGTAAADAPRPPATAAAGQPPPSAASPSASGGERGCAMRFLQYQYCGGCRQRRYCSRSCQAADWKAGHAKACKQLAAAGAAARTAGAGKAAGAEGGEAGARAGPDGKGGPGAAGCGAAAPSAASRGEGS